MTSNEPTRPSFAEGGDDNVSGVVQDNTVNDNDIVEDINDNDIVEDSDANLGCCTRLMNFCCFVIKEGSHLRWRVVVLAGLVGFGQFFQLDIPGAIGMGDTSNTIQKQFAEAFPNEENAYTNKMNQLLYSVVFYPNIIVPLIGGVLIDRVIGPQASVLLFTGINFIGTAIFATGIATANFPAMVIGRLINGGTEETIVVLRFCFVARFFKVSDGIKGITLGLSAAACVTQIGTMISFPVTTAIASSLGVTAAGFIGCLATFLSFLVAVVLVLVDRYAIKNKIIAPIHHKDAKRIFDERNSDHHGQTVVSDNETEKKGICQCISGFENPFTLSQLTSLSLCFWMVCCTFNFFFPAVYPFMGYAKDFFERKWKLSSGESVLAISSYSLMTIVSCLVCGVVIDAVGRNSLFLMFAALVTALVHILFTTTLAPPMALMMIYGFIQGLFLSAIQACIPMTVHESSTGLAVGIIVALNSLYIAIVPLISGTILDANTKTIQKPGPTPGKTTTYSQATVEGYLKVQLFMIGITVIFFIFSVCLFITDKWRNKGLCSSSPKERKRIYDEMAKASEAPEAVES